MILITLAGCAPSAVAPGATDAPRGSAPDRHPDNQAVVAAPAATATLAAAPACGAPIAVGDRVICNWMARGVYYPGRVDRAADGAVTIQYDDGDREQTVAARCVHEPAGAAPAAEVATPDPDGIAGAYHIAAGHNPNGTTYAGDVAIAKQGGVYQLSWTIGGSAAYAGVGLHVGDVLGVGWGPGGAPAVVVYRVNGGKLSGTWAAGARAGVGEEDLDGPAGLSGTYRITRGKNPDGSSYTGSVTIKPHGKLYQLAWSIPGTSYAGVGILKGDVLSVGWGSGSVPGVVAYAVGAQSLDGVWANPGDTSQGSERLERK